MEVDQQSHWYIEQPEMRQKLSLINRMKNVLALELDHDFAFHDDVSTKATIHLYGFINEGHSFLPFHSKPELFEFIGEAGFISDSNNPGPSFR